MDWEGSVLTLASGTGKPAGSLGLRPQRPRDGFTESTMAVGVEMPVEFEVVTGEIRTGGLAEFGDRIDHGDTGLLADLDHHVLADRGGGQ